MYLAAKFNQRVDNTFWFDIYFTQCVDGVYHSTLCGTLMITKSGRTQFLITTPLSNEELQEDFDNLNSNLCQMISFIS